jgi:hypothetical protein
MHTLPHPMKLAGPLVDRILPSGPGWLLVIGAAVLVLAVLVLGWVARHMGGSTFEGEAFMASLGSSRYVRSGGGR